MEVPWIGNILKVFTLFENDSRVVWFISIDPIGSSDQLNLLAARARIIQLEAELHSIDRDSKRARYEQELDFITNYPNPVKLQLEFDELKQKYQTAKGMYSLFLRIFYFQTLL